MKKSEQSATSFDLGLSQELVERTRLLTFNYRFSFILSNSMADAKLWGY